MEEDEASPLTGAAGSLGTTPTPKTEKTAPKKRVRAKKDEVLTDQPDFDPPESDEHGNMLGRRQCGGGSQGGGSNCGRQKTQICVGVGGG